VRKGRNLGGNGRIMELKIDEKLWDEAGKYEDANFKKLIVVLLLQIIKELQKGDTPETKSPAIGGFSPF